MRAILIALTVVALAPGATLVPASVSAAQAGCRASTP